LEMMDWYKKKDPNSRKWVVTGLCVRDHQIHYLWYWR
jgi:hypothetical protein